MTQTIRIPSATRERITRYFGESGVAWLAELPMLVELSAAKWGLRVGQPFEGPGQVSWTSPVVRADGTDAVLKVALPHADARHQVAALRAYNGEGAVRLLEASDDGWALLLERCRPGTPLGALSIDESNQVVVGLLPKLWSAPVTGPFPALGDVASEWVRRFAVAAPKAGYDPTIVQLAVSVAAKLGTDTPDEVLLHGDMGGGNVLAAERQPWLAIDPLPLVGDPAYDLAQLLATRMRRLREVADPVSELRRQIASLSAVLGLDRMRVAGWALVKAHGWDQGPMTARLIAEAGGL